MTNKPKRTPRAIERHLIFRDKKMQNKTGADKKKIDDFIFTLKDGAIIRERLEIIGDREIWRDTERDHHFGFLRDFIFAAHESFSGGIMGSNDDEKISAVHYTLKAEYCVLHPECNIQRFNILKKIYETEVFSVSRDNCTLTDDQLADFYGWARTALQAVHVAKYGYEVLTGAE